MTQNSKALDINEIIDELEIARDETDDRYYRDALQKAIDALLEYIVRKEGEPL